VFFIVIILAAMFISAAANLTFGLIIPLIAWMLAGMFAGRLLRGRGYGPIGDILLGIVGGFFGSLVLRLLGLGWIGGIWIIGNVVVGIIGAVLFVYLMRALVTRDFAR
jgi:uncharacterized membrane protein YeaQ/YmgE (transglycosylase-associated protein family)